MTVVAADRIEMANSSDELTLDTLFEWLEKMPVPEGYKTEIVGGHIFISPQRDVHWDIIAGIIEQLRTKFPRTRLKSDVRIDFPGHLNGFAPDVALLSDDAEKSAQGRWSYQDVQFVAEVISKNTALNDYGPKKAAYAEAKVPAYLIINPYTGKCVLHTTPKNGDYDTDARFTFGDEIDLTHTPAGLTLATDGFPRD
ncbi:Uma2 family endonuclease [Streptomyces sp. HNM0663]|uniref:Uma2 family endonuclease n=1 Tax=Streptomyces chengmaiensis TaxID=3040919 RepID=A0ABT6HXE4_9ACTN|nr:Uma2 family endonuclease [Streptomyces chengmaiensis]MDH2393031.1 Uma2 family endonuclease [Streptomyces chengmaiensis]